MMKRTKKKIMFACAGLVLAIPLGISSSKVAAATDGVWTTTLFEAGETQLQSRAYAEGRTDTGLKVSFPRNGSALKTKNTQIGDFSLEYAPTKVSTQYTVGEVQVVLTEVSTGQEIVISAEHNVGEFEVSVIFEGEQAGIYYEGGKATGLTPVANGGGLYTVVKGETLSLFYDADTKQVKAAADGASEKVVWDLSKKENDGKTIDGNLNSFGEYSVEVVGQNLASENGSIILYSLNDTSLKEYLVEESPVALFAEVTQYGLVNKEYTFPKGYASSLGAGVRARDILPTVKYNDVVVSENASAFKTKTAGTYTLEYAYGEEVKTYTIQILEDLPAFEPRMEKEFPTTAILGETKYLPRMDVYGGLEIYKSKTAKISILCDGIALLAYTDKTSGFAYNFEKAGEYEIIYTFEGTELASYKLVVSKDNNFLQSKTLKSGYTLGERVDLTDVCANIGGEEIDGEVTVQFPNGKIYANKKFFVSEIGKYVVKLDVNKNDAKYYFEKVFEVVSEPENLFETTESDLSIGYGKSEFTQRNGVKLTAKSSNLIFSYKNKINLNNYVNQTTTTKVGSKDIITISPTARPLIELSVDPDSYNNMAATGFSFYITDANNENNKIIVTVATAGINGSTWSYVKSYTPGNTAKGLGYDSRTKDITYMGVEAKLHIGNEYGTMIFHSFKGTTTSTFTAKDSKITLYYDSEKKQILVTPPNVNYHCVSMDLDDPLLCGASVWEGFSSDEVYISGAITGVKANEVNAVVYKVDGLDLEQGVFNYDEKPTVTVENNVSNLQSVKGKTITLPSARAYDKYGNSIRNVVMKAYYKNGEDLIDVNVNDGKLTTAKDGEYIVKYYARDCFGNVGESSVRVAVMQTAPTLKANLNGEQENFIKYGVTENAKVMASENVVVEGEVYSYDIVTKAYFQDGDWTELPIVNDEFAVRKYGQYKVEYLVTDFVGNTITTSYTFEVEKPTSVLFADGTPSYPAFISENTYEIFDVYMLDFENSNGDEVKLDAYINGELYTEKTYTAEKLVKKMEGYQSKSVKIEYKNGATVLKSYDVLVVPVFIEVEEEHFITGAITRSEKYFIEQYFVNEENITLKADAQKSLLTSTATAATTTFVYPLNSNALTLSMDINEKKNSSLTPITTNVKAINVRLQDAKRENNYLEFKIAREEGNNYAVLYVNGERGFGSMSGSFVGVTNDSIAFRYNNVNKSIYDANSANILYTFEKNALGELFDGFDGDVYFSVSLESTDGNEVSLQLLTLNGYMLAETSSQAYPPTILVNGDVAGVYESGKKIMIPTASGMDLFCDVDSVTVRAYDANSGAILKDTSGKEINNLPANQEYELQLTKAGSYQVEYTVTNVRGSTANKSFQILISSRAKPTLTVKGDLITKASLGDSYIIPEYEVVYQNESEENLAFVVFITPTNKHTMVASDRKVTFDRLGVHKVRYYVADIYGNYEWKEFVIVCE